MIEPRLAGPPLSAGVTYPPLPGDPPAGGEAP
jgi:hypothetical protein